MEIIFLVVILIILLTGLAGIFLFLKNRLSQPKTDDQSLLLLQNQINEISRTLDLRLGESTRAIQIQFGENSKIIKDVSEKLIHLNETNKQVMNFADQLKN